MRELGIRWTLGDVSRRGFEALQLSIWGAWRLFGVNARYAVCVNSLDVSAAKAHVGAVPRQVQWIDANAMFPHALRPYLDAGLAEGVAWKLAPFSLFDDGKELSLDNDCILWRMPSALKAWLVDEEPSVLLAEDATACFGELDKLRGSVPRDSGIRGLPAHFDLESQLLSLLELHPAVLRRELGTQGLQAAALSRGRTVHVVPLQDVTLTSPFPPHLPFVGRCGVHFVGLSAKSYPWSSEGRPAQDHIADLWDEQLDEVRQHVLGEAEHAVESVA